MSGRVGLAATTWAISAELNINPFDRGPALTLLWENDSTQEVAVWFMGGGAQGIAPVSQNHVATAPGWTVRARADLNRDGVPDLLWQNDTTGEVAVWFMGGPQGITFVSQDHVATARGWTVRGVADLNRDGVPDLLWQNDTTGEVAVWFMGGPQGITFVSQDHVATAPGWTVRATADMNRDGVPDLLWQNDSTREVAVWFMGGQQGITFVTQDHVATAPGWTLATAK